MISPFKTIDKFIAYQQNLRNKLMAIRIRQVMKKRKKDLSEDSQFLEVYYTTSMLEELDTWGYKHVWKELRLLFAGRNGSVLDIACGTGAAIKYLDMIPSLNVYGCDISSFLLERAEKHKIQSERLCCCDAMNMPYKSDEFDFAYSIGSLEHFTEEGIIQFLKECKRVTKKYSFHQIPISRNNMDEGWVKTTQAFFNNSEEWWLKKYKEVYVCNSFWEDPVSIGKWFICIN
jgi:ubiquinone/menaquinone biosynthesis C-methylase UbiE